MTIKEMEERCAMDRANIRFYEREGLLSPERLANGYRDYTEQDAETLFLHHFGTTPGKAIFGLHLTDANGRRLSYAEGLRRTWSVLWRGYGLYIPVYSLVRLWKSYKTCTADEPEPWDDYPYTRLYTIRDTRPWRGVAFVAAYVLCTLISNWAVEVSKLPPNRGELTVAEFAENYNYLCRYYDLEYSYTLGADGSWSPAATTRHDYGVIYLGSSPKPLTYTTDGDRLTGFSLSAEDCELLDVPAADRMTMLALAAVTAEPNAGVFSGAQSSIIKMLSGTPYSPAHYMWGNVTIDYTLDFSEDGETLSYRFEVKRTA